MWDASQLPAYEACAKAFEAKTGIKVNITQIAWGDYWTKLTAGFIAGTGPDAFTDHISKFAQFVDLEVLVPLEKQAAWAGGGRAPAGAPVWARASTPSSLTAIARRAIEMRSPADRRISISRSGGASVRAAAESSKSSVVSPIADTTTTTRCPAVGPIVILSTTGLRSRAWVSVLHRRKDTPGTEPLVHIFVTALPPPPPTPTTLMSCLI